MRGISFVKQSFKNLARNYTEDSVLSLPLGVVSKVKALGGLGKNPIRTIRHEGGMDLHGLSLNSQRHLRTAHRRANQFAADLTTAQPPIALKGSLNDGDLSLPDGRSLRIQARKGEEGSYRLTLSNGKPKPNWTIPSTSYDVALDPKTGQYKTQQLRFPRAFMGNRPRQQAAFTGIADEPINQIMKHISNNS